MKKRLLFDGIDILGNQFAVNQAVKFAILVLPHPAKPPLPILDMAVMVAKSAKDLLLFFLVVK